MGYMVGNTERKEGKRETEGNTGRKSRAEGREETREGKRERRTGKVDRAREIARSSPTENPFQRIQNKRKKRKTHTKKPEKENGFMFCSLFLNYLGSCSCFACFALWVNSCFKLRARRWAQCVEGFKRLKRVIFLFF